MRQDSDVNRAPALLFLVIRGNSNNVVIVTGRYGSNHVVVDGARHDKSIIIIRVFTDSTQTSFAIPSCTEALLSACLLTQLMDSGYRVG
jgi:hypothetical protein